MSGCSIGDSGGFAAGLGALAALIAAAGLAVGAIAGFDFAACFGGCTTERTGGEHKAGDECERGFDEVLRHC